MRQRSLNSNGFPSVFTFPKRLLSLRRGSENKAMVRICHAGNSYLKSCWAPFDVARKFLDPTKQNLAILLNGKLPDP